MLQNYCSSKPNLAFNRNFVNYCWSFITGAGIHGPTPNASWDQVVWTIQKWEISVNDQKNKKISDQFGPSGP